MLSQLISIVAPVYICAALGYAWVRFGKRFDIEMVTDLVALVGAPCLVFSALSGIEVERSALLRIALASCLVTAAFSLLAWILLRLVKLPRTSFMGPMAFGNTGNLGLPLCLFAFGEEGLALGVCFFATTVLLNFTAGQWFWSGKVSFRQLATTPLAYAPVLAAIVVLTDTEVPLWIENTTSLLGQMTIPLMAFTLGVTLGKLRLSLIWQSCWLSVARLLLVCGAGLAVAEALGLTGVERAVFLLQCAMPPAVFNYLLAQKFNRDPVAVAGLIVVSTLLAFLVLPGILAYLL
ncbi:MAG: AEC family transporter [Planctomycetota bacterium]